MKYDDAARKLESLNKKLTALNAQIAEVRRTAEPQDVKDYAFTRSSGDAATWKDLFGRKNDLIVIHNMGSSCAYCTLWADGFNGAYDHLANRAAFVVASPDKPEAQARFAASRHWRFPMITYRGTTFAEDMGYGDAGNFMPGVSVFQKKNGKVVRVSDTSFGPGDIYCGVWHLFDLIPQGADGWRPRLKY
jgi:predicted dithiol-disulfide oxidoreductase (DUF899 family)